MTTEVSKIFDAQLSRCANCQAETSSGDSFCQECGAAQIQPARAVSSPNMGRLHPAWGKKTVALPALGLIILGLILGPMFLLGFEKSYSNFSNQYVTEQSIRAYKENRLDEAAVPLERLALTHKLNDEQRNVLNDVYLARADQRAARLDYLSAIADLNRITPDYTKLAVANVKRGGFEQMLKVQKQDQLLATKSPIRNGNRAKSLAMKKSVALTKENVAPVADSPPTTNPPNLPSRADRQLAANNVPKSSVSLPVVAGEKFEDRANQPQNVVPTQSTGDVESKLNTVSNSLAAKKSEMNASKNNLKGTKSVKSAQATESDMIRYNELLAGYFSQERKHATASSEPPSLKEWLDQNRPTF